MSNKFRARIAAVCEALERRAPAEAALAGPLFVAWSGETSDEEIRAARKRGQRPIYYARPVAPGEFEVIEDPSPSWVRWSGPENAPGGAKKLHVELATGEIREEPLEGWVRPESAEPCGEELL